MKIVFNNSSLDELLFNNLKNTGIEFSDQHDPRLRATVRKDNISLAVRVCSGSKRHYKKLANYPTTSIRAFKNEATKYIGLIARDPNRLNSITLNECFELLWLPYATKYLKDIANPSGRWKTHIKPTKLGHMKVVQIRSIDIEQRLQEVLGSGLKPATINKIHMLISKVFNLAIKHQICPNNPCVGIRQRSENNIVKTVFTEQQVSIFLKIAMQDQSFYNARALVLSLLSGMRIGEVLSLKVENAYSDEYLDLQQTKNGKPFRVFLNKPAQKLIQDLKQATHSSYLFPSNRNNNQPISYPRTTFNRIFKKMQEEGGAEEFDPNGTYSIHMLRRTFAVLLQQQTSDIYAVSQALNHSSITVTQRYTSICNKNMSNNVNKLNHILEVPPC